MLIVVRMSSCSERVFAMFSFVLLYTLLGL